MVDLGEPRLGGATVPDPNSPSWRYNENQMPRQVGVVKGSGASGAIMGASPPPEMVPFTGISNRWAQVSVASIPIS